MGLDIYLYRHDDLEASTKLEAEYEKESERIWDEAAPGKEYKDMTSEQKDFARDKTKALAEGLGLNENGSDDKRSECLEVNSKKHPEHMFKVGYFRSSYNNGGINHVMENAIGKSLYDLFPHDDGEYHIKPDWKKSLKLTRQVLKEFRAVAQKGALFVTTSRRNPFSPNRVGASSEQEAIAVVRKELERKGKDQVGFDSYSNGIGTFHLKDPLEVVGIIEGEDKFLGKKAPCTFVVFRSSDKEEGGYKFYLEALEVIEETIEYVLKQKDQDKFVLHWSG